MMLLAAVTPLGAAPMTGDGGVSEFYEWSAHVPRPGRLLRRQVLPADMLPANAASGERILYASTSDFGGERRVVVSGMVFLPGGKPPKGGWPVIAWAHGTVGTADVCAPSWTGPSERDREYLARWLGEGYAVVASDYEGLGTKGPHPYMGLGSAGRSTLDALRAARGRYPLSSRSVVVGQSQGAHAAFGAGLVQPGYAPDVDLRGVVATGLPGEGGFAPLDTGASNPIPRAEPRDPATVRDPVRRLDMTQFDPWFVVFLQYFPSYPLAVPGFEAERYLTPEAMTMLRELESGCASPRVSLMFKERPAPERLLTADPSALEVGIARYRRYPEPRFAVPVFIGIGRHDELTAPELSFNVARAACAAGSRVTVKFYNRGSHSGTVMASLADSVPFVRAAMDGHASSGNCAGLAWPGRD